MDAGMSCGFLLWFGLMRRTTCSSVFLQLTPRLFLLWLRLWVMLMTAGQSEHSPAIHLLMVCVCVCASVTGSAAFRVRREPVSKGWQMWDVHSTRQDTSLIVSSNFSTSFISRFLVEASAPLSPPSCIPLFACEPVAMVTKKPLL